MSSNNKPSIVFCHGLWADGSCFNKLIPALQEEGYDVMACEYGLNSLESDVALVKAVLGRVSSPAILVGHSYGGTVITAAGEDSRVAGLVYISALAPDSDETSQQQQNKFPKTKVFNFIDVTDGRVWLKEEGTSCFVGDLSEEDQKLVYATATSPVVDIFDQKMEGTAWKSKPSWYIVAKHDQTVNPELQRFASKRMNAQVTELESDHVPMLSHPEDVLKVIRAAAESVQESSEYAQPRSSKSKEGSSAHP